MSQVKTVVVAGDITLNWNLARRIVTQRTRVLWDPDHYMQAYVQVGGAALLGRLIHAAAEGTANVLYPDPLARPRVPGTPPFWHSYAICAQFPKKGRQTNNELVWRVQEFLGLDRQRSDLPENPAERLLSQDEGEGDIIVLDEANQGFRDLKDEVWPKSLVKPRDGAWLLLKSTRPSFDEKQAQIWNQLAEGFQGRVVLVVTINDLRLEGMRISRGLSWETTVEDLVREVRSIRQRVPYAHLVVSLYTEGAVIFSDHGTNDQSIDLYYDPLCMEGNWQTEHPGKMAGYTLCLVAGIALQMIRSTEDVGPGVAAGLDASRDLHENGFVIAGQQHFPGESPFPEELRFPFERLAKRLNNGPLKTSENVAGPFLNFRVDDCRKGWTILGKSYADIGKVLNLAESIVEWGIDDVRLAAPVQRFGRLTVIDRHEIESLTAIRSLMVEYMESRTERVPLSIAVFGKPGSGKSFTIRAVAESLASDRGLKDLTFNLSQFTKPEAIVDALHQVRDIALSGVMPLVFWDEFDTELGGTKLGWLRYFLAPMQDGKFQAGSLTHDIGTAMFVFAGGNSERMNDFESNATKEVKGPDFVSRLKGYVDVPGLDHEEKAGRKYQSDVLLRRGLLLRSILVRSAAHLVQEIEKPKEGKDNNSVGLDVAFRQGKQRINVDSGILKAFLQVGTYKYGARSMESIVKMSTLSGKSMFDRSSLPAEAQLKLHVDSDFLSYVMNAQESQ
jgi:hypothetical protein